MRFASLEETMAKIKIALNNAGGELDHRIAEDDVAAIGTFVDFLQELGNLNDGDTFVVTELAD